MISKIEEEIILSPVLIVHLSSGYYDFSIRYEGSDLYNVVGEGSDCRGTLLTKVDPSNFFGRFVSSHLSIL